MAFSFSKTIVAFVKFFFNRSTVSLIYSPVICQCLTCFPFRLLSSENAQRSNKNWNICLIFAVGQNLATNVICKMKNSNHFSWIPVLLSFDGSIFFQILTCSGDINQLSDKIRGGISIISKLVADYKRMHLSFLIANLTLFQDFCLFRHQRVDL